MESDLNPCDAAWVLWMRQKSYYPNLMSIYGCKLHVPGSTHILLVLVLILPVLYEPVLLGLALALVPVELVELVVVVIIIIVSSTCIGNTTTTHPHHQGGGRINMAKNMNSVVYTVHKQTLLLNRREKIDYT